MPFKIQLKYFNLVKYAQNPGGAIAPSCSPLRTPMDTRVLIDLLYALQTSSLGMFRIRDTDVVVILLSNLHHIQALNTAAETWISFKPWKTSTMVSLNYSASSRAVTMCKAMALCHAFTISSSKLN